MISFPEKPKSVTKQRHKCPFYGFHMTYGLLIDQSGNQCALIEDSYSPCQMEIDNQTPNWDECLLNNEQNKSGVELIMNDSKIFPNEFRPTDAESWEGIAFKDWQKYIMGQNTV